MVITPSWIVTPTYPILNIVPHGSETPIIVDATGGIDKVKKSCILKTSFALWLCGGMG
jgi:hypothetical protein